MLFGGRLVGVQKLDIDGPNRAPRGRQRRARNRALELADVAGPVIAL